MKVDSSQCTLQHTRKSYIIVDQRWIIESYGGTLDILGMTEDCIGSTIWNYLPELVDAKSDLLRVLHNVLPQLNLDYVSRSFGGPTQHTVLSILPYRDAHGHSMLLIIASDETEHTANLQQLVEQQQELSEQNTQLQQQHRELHQTNAELQRLDTIKTTFLSVAAHELRNPLTSITGYIELLLDDAYGVLAEEQRASLKMVRQSARRLQNITAELLDVTRLEAGNIELALQPVDIETTTKTIIEEYRAQFAARNQHVTLESEHLSPLLCDETRIAQVISNLLENASKYTPHGGHVTVHIGQAETSDCLRIAVTDTGIGISSYEQSRVFQRFFRASNSKSAGISGTGLGLYITRALVELHGGRIWVESELKKGSTFYVQLPRRTPASTLFREPMTMPSFTISERTAARGRESRV